MVMSAANRNRMLEQMQANEARRMQRMLSALPPVPTHRVPNTWSLIAAMPSVPTHRAVKTTVARRAGESLANKLKRIQELQRRVEQQRRAQRRGRW